jgi:hypothetical protein
MGGRDAVAASSFETPRFARLLRMRAVWLYFSGTVAGLVASET